MTSLDLKKATEVDDVGPLLTSEQKQKLGERVVTDYEEDNSSREEWLRRYDNALKLAGQTTEVKNWPWPKASNVKYPLMSIAALQFHARAYPALIPSKGVVQAAMMGEDLEGTKQERVDRVTTHMNYQIMYEMEDWEEEMDKLLIALPITGCEFKKTFYHAKLEHNVSKHVRAKDLVLHYYARNVETAARKTQVIEKSLNEIIEGIRQGIYCDILSKIDTEPKNTRDQVGDRTEDKIQGTKPPKEDDDTPHVLLEWHGYYDLDGDGYKEPWIVLVHRDTKEVLRVVARYQYDNIAWDKEKVVSIIADEYFTQYNFIPSPDGGVYGMGFGTLIGPMNKAVNTIINQLVDAGTLQNLPIGFISRNLRMKGGSMAFRPGEWKQVNIANQDLRSGIFPIQFQQPSSVLFNLLGMLISAGERLTSTTDMMVGENPGQNQKATTTQAVLDQGMKVFTAIYKRIRRSMSHEFRKLFWLNSLYLDEQDYFNVLDLNVEGLKRSQLKQIARADYNLADMAIFPTADPNSVTQQSKMEKAQFLFSLAQAQLVPMEVALRRLFEALDMDNIDELLPEGPSPAEQAAQQQQQMQMALVGKEVEIKDREVSVKEQDAATRMLDVAMKHKQGADKLDLDTLVAGLNVRGPTSK